MPKYLTAPLPSTQMPRGIPYIVGNEAAERFSFYGMKAILSIFMAEYLLDRSGAPAPMSEGEATVCFHWFVSAVYFFPLAGALLADGWLGKYRTIMSLSIVYCLGHLALALDATRLGLFAGLAMIAIGSGGIKPCVSAHVGDQFGQTNQHLLTRVFAWFYFAINFGSFFSYLLIPKFLEWYGPHFAFAVPGVLMLLATLVFWAGRNEFVHIPAAGGAALCGTFQLEGLRPVLKLVPIYLFVVVFWALFDQTGSSWVFQAKRMNLHWLGMDWLPSQLGLVNPILVLVYVPLFSYVVYPAIDRVFPLTPLRKITLGFFVAALAFVVSAGIENMIQAGQTPSIAWQMLAYAVLTAAEVMVSITCLEFSYTQAPRELKSFIMALYLLSVSGGNMLTAKVNEAIHNADGTSKLPGSSYYWFFAGLMAATAVLFIFVALCYREHTYIQEEQPAAT